jgi:serine/threonine protein kinase
MCYIHRRTAPDEKQTAKADVYSFGLVLWEIVTGRFPFPDYNIAKLISLVHAKGER